MKILFGLGNPGDKYQKNRHNTGFLAANKIKEKYDFPDFDFNKKFNAEMSKGNVENKEVLLVQPHTMMNNSGDAVKSISDFYKLSPDNFIVIHDDIDLALGKYRISTDSSSAGHRGVQDIISKIGTQNFTRIRIGIANDELRTKIDPSDFVLQNFSNDELKTIEDISVKIAEEIEKLL